MSDWSLFDTLTTIPDPGPKRDRLIAETWMGYSIYHYDKDVPERCYYCLVDPSLDPVVEFTGWPTGDRKTEAEAWADCPKFSVDIAAAYTLENTIYDKGYSATYAQCLAVVLLESVIPNNEEDQWWQFAHATPEQRSKAALVAWAKMQARKQEEDAI